MKTLLLVSSFALASAASAALIPFDLMGKAGPGLLSGNENGTINGTPGTGGEIGAGIFFDDVAKTLTVNVGWGSANGFTNLTANATAAHVHGPTAASGTASFTQNAGVLIGLDGGVFTFNNSLSGGFITGTSAALSAVNEAALFNGRLYINVHTSINGGGEIRGNLIPVPEPSTYAAIAGALAIGVAVVARRRRS